MPGSLNSLETIYRQLKKKYEDEHNRRQAGDFHYWEKTLRFKRLEWKKDFWEKLILGSYGLFAGYGESYQRLFCSLIAILATTTFIVNWIEKAKSCSELYFLDFLYLGNKCHLFEGFLDRARIVVFNISH